MAVNGYIMFNGANTEDLYFGDMSVDYVYYGNVLVWAKIKYLFKDNYYNTTDKLFEFIPSTDITLSSVSTLGENYNTVCILRILNEVGLCVAYQNGNGAQSDVTIYNKTGVLKTWTSLGTITLYAGNKYYISMRGPGDGMYVPQYVGLTGNYKSFSNIQNVNSVYSGAANHRCSGEAATFAEITQLQNPVDSYFIWRGAPLSNGLQPSNGGEGNPYPYLLHRDMSRVTHIFTDSDFGNTGGSFNDDIDRYAFMFYTMGTNNGVEFIMNVGDGYGAGFNAGNGTKVFTNCKHKIYTTKWPWSNNKIRSMTPVDNEPSNPSDFDIYYKSAANTWTGGINYRAVVIWRNNQWEVATGYTAIVDEDNTYNATNYCEMVSDNYAKDFNLVSVQNGDKYFVRINGSDI